MLLMHSIKLSYLLSLLTYLLALALASRATGFGLGVGLENAGLEPIRA